MVNFVDFRVGGAPLGGGGQLKPSSFVIETKKFVWTTMAGPESDSELSDVTNKVLILSP